MELISGQMALLAIGITCYYISGTNMVAVINKLVVYVDRNITKSLSAGFFWTCGKNIYYSNGSVNYKITISKLYA